MRFEIIPVTHYQQNCTLLICEITGQAVLVDPGGDIDLLLRKLAQQGVELQSIWVTHGHMDHVGGVAQLAERCGVPVHGPHRDDAFWLDALPEQCRAFGFSETKTFTPDRWLADGDTVTVGEVPWQVLHCPGHTPGHVVFFSPDSALALVGDVLFKGSIGRTDFPQGNYQALIDSIRYKLWPLGGQVRFIPGHGPMSSFGEEMLSNPYVAEKLFR